VGVANSRVEPWHPAARAAVLLGVSVGAGALCGGLGVIGQLAIMSPFGVVVGAVIGLLIWPVAILTLWRVSLSSAMPIVLVPAVVTAVLGGLVTDAPFYSMLSVPVFIACQMIARLVLRPVARHCPAPGMCRGCGYDRSGLDRCPECGRLAEPWEPSERPWRRRTASAVVVAVLGVVAPNVVILLAMLAHAFRSS